MKKQNIKKIEENTITKKVIIITIVVIAVLGILYFVSFYGVENGKFGKKYVPSRTQEAVITYDRASIGTVFNRNDKEYYVAFDDLNDNSNKYFLNTISDYLRKEKKLPIYLVDMTFTINKKYRSKDSNYTAQNSNELSIKNPTLIKVKDGFNVLYLDDINKIKEELNK